MKRVRFSNLKAMSLSPAHYEARVDEPFERTRAMRVGTVTHQLVLGPQPGKEVLRFHGEKRAGKAWEAFETAHPNVEIATNPEWLEAEAIARAVLAHPKASELLAGTEREKQLEWELDGLPCATGGIDAIGCGRLIDLKTTTSTEPRKWARQAHAMCYPAQLVWYQYGARANGLTADELYLIGVETDRPYAVTPFKLTPATEEVGRRQIAAWLERLKRSLEDNHWPEYTQTVLDLEPMPWMENDDDAE